jgi:23S rRNA pseudouridine2605 synthase
MPRDNDKDNDSRGRRDRPPGGKGRSGPVRGPEKKFAKKFAKRGLGGKNFESKSEGERRPYPGKSEGARSFAKKPYSGSGKPYAGKRERAPQRRDYDDTPRARDNRPNYDRAPRPDRGDARPAPRFQDRKFGDGKPHAPRDGDKRPHTQRGEGFRKDRDRPQRDRPHGGPRGDRPERKFGGDKRFSRATPGDRKSAPRDRKSDPGDRKSDPGDRKSDPGDRGPRKDFGSDRSNAKPWQKRDDRGGGNERPRFSRSREDRPKFDRPRRDRNGDTGRPEGRDDWQEHPRSDRRPERFADRPRRDNEDDSRVFAKRPAFGGRAAYRERAPDEPRPARPPRQKKSGERIAKVVARAGLASRRDAEGWIVQGRVTVNGRVINSPALDVTVNDVVTVDGKPLPPRQRTRLFLYHKPRGLMTTHADPEGRPTVFDNLPEALPRLISIGRLDFNTEGLLLLTNDGGLARALELPETGWLRRYRVRAHGEVTQAQLDELKKGIEVDGVKYGPIDATLERDQGANVWLVFAIREGKNREVRNVMAHLGLEVNRLIRVSYGPFQLGELAEGEVEEVKTRVLREQLGEKIAVLAGADFNRPMPGEPEAGAESEVADAPRGKKPFRPAGKSGLIADRKGRRVLVQRTGSEEARARNEAEASGYGPPRRPQRGYHGKRDLTPRDE